MEKGKFLDDAVLRDSKNFVFGYSPGTPVSPNDQRGVNDTYGKDALTTPRHYHHRHLSATGTLMVPPSPALGGVGGGGGCGGGLPLMTFTPPTASPDTARLLGELGIRPGERNGASCC